MFFKGVCLALCLLLSVSDCAFDANAFPKCSWKDSVCVASLVHSILKQYSEKGIEELQIPPIDPMQLKGIDIPIVGFFNITLDEGEVKGLKGCKISKIVNDFHKGVTKTDLSCDLEIKAKFRFDDVSPIIQRFIGQNSIDGDGEVILKLDKMHLQTQIFYDVVKMNDGEIGFKFLNDHITKFDVENFHMTAHKIFFGKQDVSEIVEKFFNENWKFIMPSFGKGIFDVAMRILIEILAGFFEKIPAKYYYIDNLAPLVKN